MSKKKLTQAELYVRVIREREQARKRFIAKLVRNSRNRQGLRIWLDKEHTKNHYLTENDVRVLVKDEACVNILQDGKFYVYKGEFVTDRWIPWSVLSHVLKVSKKKKTRIENRVEARRGFKRVCDDCDARFYDLCKPAGRCPSCGSRWRNSSMVEQMAAKTAMEAETNGVRKAKRKLDKGTLTEDAARKLHLRVGMGRADNLSRRKLQEFCAQHGYRLLK